MKPPKVHRTSAPPQGFFVNSFLLESDEGLVVVDTQFLVSAGRELRTLLERLRKPLAAVVVTHPHPDHYNGLAILLEGCSAVPVYTTRATIDGMSATQATKRSQWAPVYGND